MKRSTKTGFQTAEFPRVFGIGNEQENEFARQSIGRASITIRRARDLWLRLQDVLANGPMSAKDVKREAIEAGISAKSLRTAREALGINPAKTGFEGGWVWSLPRCPTDPEDDRVL